jgi:acyl-CoA synthetase (NDP forming)
MSMEQVAIRLIRAAAAEGRDTLLEPELYTLLQAGGVATPAFYCVKAGDEDLPAPLVLPGVKAVVKVVSPQITHKTEMGGVRIVANTPAAIAAAAREVRENVRQRGGDALAATVREVLVSEFVRGDDALGGQLFVGLRHSDDFGPVLAVGFGGLDAEEMAERFTPGQGTVLASPVLTTPEELHAKLAASFVGRRLSGSTREAKRRATDASVIEVLRFFGQVATDLSNQPQNGFIVTDFEVNPFFATGDRLVAVDAFLKFRMGVVPFRTTLLGQVETLLQPRTVAIMGVSAKDLNPGRVILRNLLREQFPLENIRVIRADCAEVDGVACCPSITDLPWRADLVVVAVGAQQVPDIIQEALRTAKVTSMVLIPGGMGETEEGQEADLAVRKAMAEARAAGAYSPVLVGPNCLGIRSRPGRYDTLFIPSMKLPLPEAGGVQNVGLVCQSGAFMITRMSDLPFLDPRYSISTGNQLDLSLTDFVEALLDEGVVEVLGLYIEGFQPLDGLRLAKLIQRARKAGKDVLVYKAGRTSEGRTASSSHTASISGDYASCAELLKDAGALVASSFEEFNLLLTFLSMLRGKHVNGTRLAALSNAGYETVGIADNLLTSPKFSLATYSPAGAASIQGILAANRLGALVNLRNPLDITPMAPDKVYADCLQAMVDDPNIDAVVVGVVPLTPAMKTLPPGVDPRGVDTVEAPTGLPALLPPIVAASSKPVVVTVDSGVLFDPLVAGLRRGGVPTFRSVDAAMRAFQRYLAYRMGA